MQRDKKNVTYHVENNNSMETNSELTQMSELAKKDIKGIITTVFHMFRKLNRVTEEKKITQIKFLKMKTTMCDIKDTLKSINGRLDTVEEKIQFSNMQHRKNNQKFFGNSTELWNNFRQPNIWVIQVHKEARERARIVEEIMARNFLSLMKTINSLRIQ